MTVQLGLDVPPQPSVLRHGALAQFEAQGTVIFIPDSDTATLDETLRAAHLIDGWASLVKMRDRNEARVKDWLERGPATAAQLPRSTPRVAEVEARSRLRAETAIAADVSGLEALKKGLARFAPDVQTALHAVDATARNIARRRLAASRAQVAEEAKRYLTGFDDKLFDPSKAKLEFPDNVALRDPTAASGDVAALRKGVAALAAIEAEQVREILGGLLPALTAPNQVAALTAAFSKIRNAAAAVARESAVRAELGIAQPVLHRLDVPSGDDAVSDEALVELLIRALARVWAAQAAVAKRNEAKLISRDDERDERGPAAALGDRLRKAGFGADAGPIERFNPDAVGPWAYMGVVEAAVGDLAGPGPSLVRQAVADVYEATGAEPAATFQEMAGTMAAFLILHKVCPPLAVAADIVLAGKAIYEVASEYVLKSDAWHCTLDPARSFGVEPSVLRLALEIVGELAGIIPGGRAFTATSIVAPLTAAMLP